MKQLAWLRASAPLLALFTASSVSAQESSEPNTNETAFEIDEITVYGARLQNQRAIDFKRNSSRIVDSLTQDDTGRQPDFNIGDALRRASGVVTVIDEDEGQFVSIRGISPDLTHVTFDGSTIATGVEGDTRRVAMEFLPASVVKRMDVLKSRTPSSDGNAIGGQVNLVTRSAYDTDGFHAVATALAGYFDGNNSPHGIDDSSGKNGLSTRINGAISNTFGKDDMFGFVLAVAYLHKDRDEERIIPISFQGDPATVGANVAPNLTIYSTYHNPVDRIGGFGKLEFKPNDAFYSSIQGHYFYQEDFARRESELILGGTPTFNAPTSGTVTGANIIVGTDTFKAKNTQKGGQYNLEYSVTPTKVFDFRASHSVGEFKQTSPDIDFNSFGTQTFDYRYQYENGFPRITFDNPDIAGNNDNLGLASVRPFLTDFDNKVSEVEANFSSDYGEEGGGYEAGFLWRKTQQTQFFERTVYDLTGTGETLSDFLAPTNYTPLFRDDVPQRFINTDAVLAFVNGLPNTTTGGVTYDVQETVKAGYASLNYVAENWQIIAGLRYEGTSVTSISGLETQTGSYDNVLPSALFIYNPSDTIRLRFSYAKALGRPDIGDVRITVIEDPSAAILSISGGNPQLKARTSNNYDISAEYYFDNGASLMSLGLFHKDISNEIIRESRNITFNGRPALANRPVNAETAKVSGFEVSFVKDSFDFLPEPFQGLGMSANYTYIDASTTLAGGAKVDFLFEQPSHIANVALFYQLGGFEGQISYNYSGEYHNAFAGNLNNTDTFSAYKTFDLQARYALNDHFIVLGEVRNLFAEDLERRTGANGAFINDLSKFGRSLWLGVTYKY